MCRYKTVPVHVHCSTCIPAHPILNLYTVLYPHHQLPLSLSPLRPILPCPLPHTVHQDVRPNPHRVPCPESSPARPPYPHHAACGAPSLWGGASRHTHRLWVLRQHAEHAPADRCRALSTEPRSECCFGYMYCTCVSYVHHTYSTMYIS